MKREFTNNLERWKSSKKNPTKTKKNQHLVQKMLQLDGSQTCPAGEKRSWENLHKRKQLYAKRWRKNIGCAKGTLWVGERFTKWVGKRYRDWKCRLNCLLWVWGDVEREGVEFEIPHYEVWILSCEQHRMTEASWRGIWYDQNYALERLSWCRRILREGEGE